MGIQKEMVATGMNLDYIVYRTLHRDRFKGNVQDVLCLYMYTINGGICSVLNQRECVAGMVEGYCAPKKFYKFFK